MNVIAVDLETDALHHTGGIITASFTNTHRTVAFAVNHPEQEHTEREALDKIQRIIDSADVLVAHKAHFEIKHLLNAGIKFNGQKFICTKILYWLYSGHRAKDTGLNTVGKILLNEEKVEGYNFKIKNASEYPLDGLLEYNRRDTELTYKIYKKLINEIPQGLIDFYSDMSYFLAKKEMAGMYVNIDTLHEVKEETEAKLNILESELLSGLEYPINIGAPQQLSCALYGGTFTVEKKRKVWKEFKTVPDKYVDEKYKEEINLDGLGFSTNKLDMTKDGYWPTNKNVIPTLKGRTKKAKQWITTYKEWNDLNTIYGKELNKVEDKLVDNILYGNFHAVGTQTGRISSSGDNLQQKKIRNIFTSRFGPEGRLLAVDFSGIQWRIAAMFSQDPKMIADIIDGLDPHKVTASDVFNIPYGEVTSEYKKYAKAVNFGILFGKTKYGYAKDPNLPLIKNAKIAEQYIEGVFKSRPRLREEITRRIAIARGCGKIVMENGRWYDFRGEYLKETTIFNYCAQGREPDIAFPCYFEADKQLDIRYPNDTVVVNTVHDEMVVDCRNEEVTFGAGKMILDIFRNAPKYVHRYFPEIDLSNVPIEGEAEWGPNWSDMKVLEV